MPPACAIMTAEEAAELCGVLKPRVAVPIHYAFTAGPVGIGCC
jgi:L-ascorbate metabolism protein UlaG (beta-lactamase superfamily)